MLIAILYDNGDGGFVGTVTWRDILTCVKLRIPCFISFTVISDGEFGHEESTTMFRVQFAVYNSGVDVYTFSIEGEEKTVPAANLDDKVTYSD